MKKSGAFVGDALFFVCGGCWQGDARESWSVIQGQRAG